jgi:hypothetical protein
MPTPFFVTAGGKRREGGKLNKIFSFVKTETNNGLESASKIKKESI